VGLSEAARKRLELAVAVAQEKLLATHVDHALDLVALVNENVSFTDALEIYGRVLRLDDDVARNITTRALAILGEKAKMDNLPEPVESADEPLPEETGRSFFGSLRQRMRGRVNEELRRRVEFMAARTEVALLRTHVNNALHFVDFLDPELGERDAVELYLDALDVRDAIAEVVYYLTLARLADQILPPHGSGLNSVRERQAAVPHDGDVLGGIDRA
jgi:hypothetical protein